MIRTRLNYHRPASTEEACAILAEHHGNVRVLAGGTQLLPMMHRNEVQAEHVVDPRDLGLGTIRHVGDRIEVGAMATYAGRARLQNWSAGSRHCWPAPRRASPAAARSCCRGPWSARRATTSPPVTFPACSSRLMPVSRSTVRRGLARSRPGHFSALPSSSTFEPGELVTSFTARGGADRGTASSSTAPDHGRSRPPQPSVTPRPRAGRSRSAPSRRYQTVVGIRDRAAVDELVRAAVTRPWSDVLAPGWYRAEIASVADPPRNRRAREERRMSALNRDSEVPSREIQVTVNGVRRWARVEDRQLLVEALRGPLGLTGTHIGCANGDCGACTVRIDGAIAKSCLRLAASADGADITTIEGFAPAPDELTDLQKALWEWDAFQCGLLHRRPSFRARGPARTQRPVRPRPMSVTR